MKTNENNQEKPYNKWKNIPNEFFWICSGANRHILRQCPTEYSKYFGIGGTIFFTAVMATLSGGYAFFTIFESQSLAVVFGLFWGALIFNLDRFIVNTMYSDGKHTISWLELGAGTPRLIIAIFLGIVISTPIEMRIFKDRIASEMNNMQNQETLKTQEKNQILYSNIEKKEAQIAQIQLTQHNNEISLSDLEDKLYSETNGTGVTQTQGYGPAARQLQEAVNRKRESVKNENERLDRQIETIQKELEKLYEQRDRSSEKTKVATSAMTGFTTRLEAMYRITAWKSKEECKNGESNTLFWARFLIMMLFIIIEVAPTFFKMMIASGPYDELLHEESHRKKVLAIQNVSNLNDEVNTQIQISTEKNKNKLEAEVAANKQLLEKIATVQAELLETAIEEWRNAELEKIHADPSKYIQSNTTKG